MMTSANLLTDYVQRKSPGTVAAQLRDLALFASFLCKHNYTNKINAFALQTQAETWSQITWRAVQHFVDQQIEDGNAIRSVNRRLSTIKNYANLSAKSGSLNAGEFALITTIASYSSNEAKRVDENRNITRISKKKSSDGEQIHQLTSETLVALQAYIHAGDCPQEGALLRGSLKSGA